MNEDVSDALIRAISKRFQDRPQHRLVHDDQSHVGTAQIIPFPKPATPPPHHGDAVSVALAKLMRELGEMERAGIKPSNWGVYVDATLAKAYSELR